MAQHRPAQGDQAAAAAFSPLAEDHCRGEGPQAVEAFLARLGDQIDDRTALALDEQIQERLDPSGPVGQAIRKDRRGSIAVVCALAATGAAMTIISPGNAVTLLIEWAALTMISLAYFFGRR
jgi:fatty acid/phospholipid biosynthesis enzyme